MLPTSDRLRKARTQSLHESRRYQGLPVPHEKLVAKDSSGLLQEAGTLRRRNPQARRRPRHRLGLSEDVQKLQELQRHLALFERFGRVLVNSVAKVTVKLRVVGTLEVVLDRVVIELLAVLGQSIGRFRKDFGYRGAGRHGRARHSLLLSTRMIRGHVRRRKEGRVHLQRLHR